MVFLVIKVYGKAPDISHLPPAQQREIKRQIARRIAELKKDLKKLRSKG